MFMNWLRKRNQQRRNAPRTAGRAGRWPGRWAVPSLEFLEDRTVPSPLDFTGSFSVTGANQFDSGNAVTSEGSYFLGGNFSTGTHSVGSVSTDFFGVKNGAKGSFGLDGTVGLDLGYQVFSGSLDLAYTGSVRQQFTDPGAAGQVPISTSTTWTGGSFSTQSPDFSASVGLTALLSGSAAGEAWFADQGGRTSKDFGADLSLSNVLQFNRDADGQLRFFGVPVTTAVPGTDVGGYAVRVQTVQDIPGLVAQFYRQLGEGTLSDPAVRSLLGTLEFTKPSINLSDSSLAADGSLSAHSSIDRSNQLASINLDMGGVVNTALDLPVSPLNSTSISFGKLATLDVTPVDFLVGLAAYAQQSLTVTPESQLTYQFNRPVYLQLNGQTQGPVTSVTFAPGDSLSIFVDGPITVTPTWTFSPQAHNQVDVAFGLHAALEAGFLRLSSNIASTAVLTALGLKTAKTFGPAYSQSFDLDLGAPGISVLDRQFPVYNQSLTLPSFTLGQNIPLSLVVTHTADDGLPGSLRYAINSANALSGSGPLTIYVPAGVYNLTRTGGVADPAFGDLDVFASNLTIVGAGAGQTVIDASGLGDRVLDVHAGADLHVSGVAIRHGSAPNDLGGGVLVEGATFALSDSSLIDNTASQGGGLAFTGDGGVTLTNVTVADNSAGQQGGGLANLNPDNPGRTITLTDCQVLRNQSGGSGGGIENAGTLVAHDSRVADNQAATDGGGIHTTFSALFYGSTLSGNTASGNGGAAFVDRNLPTGLVAPLTECLLQNSTVADNQARSGGGVYTLIRLNTQHATISDNRATASGGAGGIALAGAFGRGYLTNTVVAGNTSAGGSPDVLGDFSLHNSAANSMAPPGYNLIGDGSGATGFAANDLVGTAGSPIDPLLGPLQDNTGPTLTMAPLAGSPLVNAGFDYPFYIYSTHIDQRGFSRDGAPDIGAVEYLSNRTVTLTVDDEEETLRRTVRAMNHQGGTNTIDLPAGTYRLTLAGSDPGDASRGDLDIIGQDLTIQGAGSSRTIIDA